RDEVLPDGRAVAGEGLRSHARRRDVIQPVREPGFDGHRPSGPGQQPAGAPVAFEVTDLAPDLGLRAGADVPAVRPAVVAPAHGDPPVPAAVAAEVDAGRAVGGASALDSLAWHRSLLRRRSAGWRRGGRRTRPDQRAGRGATVLSGRTRPRRCG